MVRRIASGNKPLRFHTRSGVLTCTRDGEFIYLDFPSTPATETLPIGPVATALGVQPISVAKSKYYYLVVVDSAEVVRTVEPDFRKVGELPTKGVIVTASSDDPKFDFISRFFAPALGVNEDPVCGSAHCCLARYWAKQLGNRELMAYQASSRGGVLRLQFNGDRVILGGQAVTVWQGELLPKRRECSAGPSGRRVFALDCDASADSVLNNARQKPYGGVMNYFAHGRRFLGEPYYLAGTAVPDWLNVVARRVKTRSKHARLFVADSDPRMAALAGGIVQHHADDRWFHDTRAFTELCWNFTARIRDQLPADDGLRPSFLGHILVEILLDANLIAQCPAELELYYSALTAIDAHWLESAVARMATGHPGSLGEFIPLFIRERFLWDYLDDCKLCYRLNQVMRRVNLATLPPTFSDLLPAMRKMVDERRDELLTPESPGCEKSNSLEKQLR